MWCGQKSTLNTNLAITDPHLFRVRPALASVPHGLQLIEVAEPDARLVPVLIHAAVVLVLVAAIELALNRCTNGECKSYNFSLMLLQRDSLQATLTGLCVLLQY